ncbi:Uncharacterised protein [Enterobacter hormaechei]|nr:Uncharacterised protein [Enterobacter hormaechei]
MRTLVEVVRHQVDRNAIDHLQAIGAAFQARLQQIVCEVRRATFPANRLTGLVNDLPIQEWLFGDSDVIGIRVEIDRSRIVAHQQGFDDGLT